MSTETVLPPQGEYTEENMKTLKDAAHIRQNPGMYVGNTAASGLHHLVYEIVYNSVDEALAGYCKNIQVVLHADGSCSISDDGRGIPVGIKADSGKSTLEDALTIAGTSGKFDNSAYRVSAGLHGMGAKAMNALSEWCEAEVRRDGRVWQMEFERGYAISALKNLGPTPAGVSGTTISFKPDPEIFGDITFNYDTLLDRLREIAYLNKGLRIGIVDELQARNESFFSQGGIAEYVSFLNEGETVYHPPIYFNKTVNNIQVEISLQYCNRDDKIERCYCNNAFNSDGGTHLSGYRAGLTRSLTAYGKKENIYKEGLELKGEDFRFGLTVIVSIGHPDPLFESQTKVKLNNPEVEGVVASVLYECLNEYLEKNPKEGVLMCRRVNLAAEARIAAKNARDAITKRKNILGGGGLPGKLMDCTTRDREKSELFLVEGDSAGGSAESGRDRMYQAVLPLRGKVLNVEKAQLEKLLANAEIAALIAAVGLDIGNIEDTSKIRYGKIVILTDADVDGQHIRTLLLTFFFRQMRKLVEEGRLYVARPPLYKVTQKKESKFIQTREEMADVLMGRGLADTSIVVHADPDAKRNRPTAATLGSDALRKILPILADVDTAVTILERRGHSLLNFLNHLKAGALPMFQVRLGAKEHFFYSQEEVEAFRVDQSLLLKHELTIGEAVPTMAVSTDPNVKLPAEIDERFKFSRDEWHEVRMLNRALGKLAEYHFTAYDLVPLPRPAGRDPFVRYSLVNGDATKDLHNLRELYAEIRKTGEKGLTITRFKGLGEMDPEELWDTTLDPKRRTLLKVTMTDVLQAEKMFRMLMGNEVEGRRDFILKHRANVEDIDYGA